MPVKAMLTFIGAAAGQLLAVSVPPCRPFVPTAAFASSSHLVIEIPS